MLSVRRLEFEPVVTIEPWSRAQELKSQHHYKAICYLLVYANLLTVRKQHSTQQCNTQRKGGNPLYSRATFFSVLNPT